MNHVWDTLVADWPMILDKTGEHMYLSLVSVCIAGLIAIPLGIYLTSRKSLANSIITIISAVQTIPSLALFGFMIPLVGIGTTPAIIALTLYALLPMLQNTYVGISGVNPALIEAGTGMGMTRWQMMTMIQLPIARSIIMAGVRLVAVQTISLATIATYIAAGGLGDIITRGIAMINTVTIMEGAIPVSLLVISVNFILLLLNRVLTPKGLRHLNKF
ncbi:ABC transporter permease [Paenibacillus riograndensis]|uniref:Glycine betaine/carnitine/choline transport system permease protein OpuCB n=1 Tax=Paenibacillus riograndensis SBR5 TaxID=1073571 RepID=A0A0E4HA61_9BACL|nr:ABC transporter permease [Paenibacillus riograndensis]CQR55604.1 Glycine betaine/carnitine/choline transport system permease protein OpuCB [Paenibacillus riograndensis SBR5]